MYHQDLARGGSFSAMDIEPHQPLIATPNAPDFDWEQDTQPLEEVMQPEHPVGPVIQADGVEDDNNFQGREEYGPTARIQSKMICITIPQYNITPIALFDRITARVDDSWAHGEIMRILQRIAIVSEFHEDGNRHIHAYMQFHNKPQFRMNALDAALGKHGNYAKPLRQNPKFWLKYMLKHQYEGVDGDFRMVQRNFNVGQGTWEDWDISTIAYSVEEPKGSWAVVIGSLKANKYTTFDKFLESCPASLHGQFKTLKEVFFHYRSQWDLPLRAPLDELPFSFDMRTDTNVWHVQNYLNQLVTHVRANSGNPNMAPNKNVIVLWGTAGCHKSSMATRLSTYLDFIGIDFQKSFPFNGIQSARIPQVIWLDEFNGEQEQLPLPLLTTMLDAFPEKAFNHKGCSITFPKRPLIIITTNIPPARWYKIKVATGIPGQDDIYRDLLDPEHRSALNRRLWMIAKITKKIYGFPAPIPADAFDYTGPLPNDLG